MNADPTPRCPWKRGGKPQVQCALSNGHSGDHLFDPMGSGDAPRTASDPLACPFCGGAAAYIYAADHAAPHWVECATMDCQIDVTGFSQSTKEEAIAAWNARLVPPSRAPDPDWKTAYRTVEFMATSTDEDRVVLRRIRVFLDDALRVRAATPSEPSEEAQPWARLVPGGFAIFTEMQQPATMVIAHQCAECREWFFQASVLSYLTCGYCRGKRAGLRASSPAPAEPEENGCDHGALVDLVGSLLYAAPEMRDHWMEEIVEEMNRLDRVARSGAAHPSQPEKP